MKSCPHQDPEERRGAVTPQETEPELPASVEGLTTGTGALAA